ncbi:tetratricopeptide repeat protein [Saccharothrix violaceirubra]|uniref:Tetratricopeptide (TPR) repeat protein n=1 Tax=Saccharothrix violaceirubra TaxID=413306 RepID=A0A7W7T4V2_9PSEU|nr:tetratricopeptide repeat protein [Saccharothrix violaceirubra]MBB4965340.1 tetratricopeptide (TPR) repeat protein [Saccharothrix violaceirubra]
MTHQHAVAVAGSMVVQAGGDVHLAVRAETFVPRQLPARPPHFVGRADDLHALDDALLPTSAGTVVVTSVGGAGGIGKTSLVLHWAHSRSDEFPDGQLYVDLRGFSPDSEPLAAATAARGFLCALGVAPATIPVDEHAQTAQFRTLAARRRMLVVLDNAADSDQVAPLLPASSTCLVVITSRRRPGGLINSVGARHLVLDALPDREALALLAARLGSARLAREPEAVQALLRGCGGMPLALSVVAGRAAAHSRLPLSTVVDELREAGLDGLEDGEPGTDVKTVLSWSYRALDPRHAQMFALLGLAPGPDVTVEAAAALAGIPVRDARAVLRGLEQSSLLTRGDADRYRAHDLVHALAWDRAQHDVPEQVRDAARDRLADFYTRTAHAARRLLEPHDIHIELPARLRSCGPKPLSDRTDALAWFAAEHRCLWHLLVVPRSSAAWHRWQLAWAMSAYHRLSGLLGDDVRAWVHAEAAADMWPDPVVDALVHRHLGHAYVQVGEFEQARHHLVRALHEAERTDDAGSQGFVHRIASVMCEYQGLLEPAYDHAREAVALFRRTGEPLWEADAVNAAGWCAALLGRMNEAERLSREAYPVLSRYDPRGAADTLDTLGFIAHRNHRDHDALDLFRSALALYRELGDVYHVPDTLDRTGRVLHALGRTDDADRMWRQALALYRDQLRVTDARRVRRQLEGRKSDRLSEHTWPYRRR